VGTLRWTSDIDLSTRSQRLGRMGFSRAECGTIVLISGTDLETRSVRPRRMDFSTKHGNVGPDLGEDLGSEIYPSTTI
jgi:hypothetical protein